MELGFYLRPNGHRQATQWLVIVDEFTRENLCLEVGYNFTSNDIIDELAKLSATRGLPQFIRSDNGPELIAEKLRGWLENLDVGALYIAPGSPWENAYAESFNSRFRDEFLALEVFDNLQAARKLTGFWRANYNEHRPHSSLDYMTPADFARQVFCFSRLRSFSKTLPEGRRKQSKL